LRLLNPWVLGAGRRGEKKREERGTSHRPADRKEETKRGATERSLLNGAKEIHLIISKKKNEKKKKDGMQYKNE